MAWASHAIRCSRCLRCDSCSNRAFAASSESLSPRDHGLTYLKSEIVQALPREVVDGVPQAAEAVAHAGALTVLRLMTNSELSSASSHGPTEKLHHASL